MKLLLSFVASLLMSFSPLFAQQDSLYMCPGDTTDLSFHGLSFPAFEAPETINFQTDALLWLTQEDGTATLTGDFIQGGNPENGFTADILFVNRMNWEEWSNQLSPTSYIDDNDAIEDEYLDWFYYIMDPSSTLSGFGSYEGSELQLSHAPASNYYGYQVGVGTNQQVPLTDGQGGWALVQGTFVNSETGYSDLEFLNSINIYLTYGCDPNAQSIVSPEAAAVQFSLFPNPAEDWITVKSNGYSAIRRMDYTIFDAMGRAVIQGQLSAATINVSELPAGSYTLLLADDSKQAPLRFVKK